MIISYSFLFKKVWNFPAHQAIFRLWWIAIQWISLTIFTLLSTVHNATLLCGSWQGSVLLNNNIKVRCWAPLTERVSWYKVGSEILTAATVSLTISSSQEFLSSPPYIFSIPFPVSLSSWSTTGKYSQIYFSVKYT